MQDVAFEISRRSHHHEHRNADVTHSHEQSISDEVAQHEQELREHPRTKRGSWLATDLGELGHLSSLEHPFESRGMSTATRVLGLEFGNLLGNARGELVEAAAQGLVVVDAYTWRVAVGDACPSTFWISDTGVSLFSMALAIV